MSYTITNTAGKNLMSIGEAVVDTSLGISLIGKNYHNYGQLIANNFVRLLEHHANTTQPDTPIEGQIWYDSNNKILHYFDGVKFKPMASYVSSSSSPTRALIGDQWWDTTSNKLMIYTGTTWIQIATQDSAEALIHQFVPKGFIGLWVANVAIPAGWSACNGQNNTPNLVNAVPSPLLTYIQKTTG